MSSSSSSVSLCPAMAWTVTVLLYYCTLMRDLNPIIISTVILHALFFFIKKKLVVFFCIFFLSFLPPSPPYSVQHNDLEQHRQSELFCVFFVLFFFDICIYQCIDIVTYTIVMTIHRKRTTCTRLTDNLSSTVSFFSCESPSK